MQLLSFFLRKYRFFLFFLFLESIALFLIIQNHSFHKSKYVSSANSFSGGLYEKISNLKNYFSLKEQNSSLIDENLRLKQENEIFKNKSETDSLKSLSFTKSKFIFNAAKITKNSYNAKYNFLLIDKGSKDSIQSEMAVVNSIGIIGVTEKSSTHYTRVQSILNLDSKINAKLKNNNFFGTLTWDGKNYNIVQLIDIERQAPVKIGDTIVTGERSAIFPEGIPIGRVIKTNQERTTTSSVDVELFNDMSNLRNVYVIKNTHQQEIKDLENKNE